MNKQTIESNEAGNLYSVKRYNCSKSGAEMIAYSGTYRYFCELDMQEMLRIKDLKEKKKKINAIDLDAVVAMYSSR